MEVCSLWALVAPEVLCCVSQCLSPWRTSVVIGGGLGHCEAPTVI